MNLIIQALHAIPEAQLQHIAHLTESQTPVRIGEHTYRFSSAHAHPTLAGYCFDHQIDYGLVPKHFSFNDIGLVVMDMDSTLINIECIDEIADMQGLKPQVAAITEAAMRGEIDFAESLRRRVALLKGLEVSALQQVYEQRLQLNPGAMAMLARLQAMNIKTLLVSGGFVFFTERLKARLGLDAAHANVLEVVAGKLTGRVLGDIVDAEAKARYLVQMRDELGLQPEQVIAMGDGANDLKMMAQAGISIAYHAKPVVRAQASYALNFVGLYGLINLLDSGSIAEPEGAELPPDFDPISEGEISLVTRSLSAVWHPCSQMKQYQTFPLLAIRQARGAWLFDEQGGRLLDAVSSWWVNLFGHCNPRINAAISDQLNTLEHVMLAGFTHAPVVELSERLRQLAPAGLGHCFYASDGAAAIEIALKMSAHYWRNTGKSAKNQFISLQHSYHGETLGALSVTDIPLFRDEYGALLRQQATVPSPDSRLAAEGETAEQYASRCADALGEYLHKHHRELAAFIVEPLVQGAAGMGMYPSLYLQRARALCDQYDVHLIADEIAVGMGRTGTLFACEQANISPDFLCLSKGLTGGYLPLSVVMTHGQIYQAFYADQTARGFLHSHSYTGNPLACRAALATLDIFAQDDVLANNRRKAGRLNQLAEPLRHHRVVSNWRNTGMIWAFEVNTPHADFAQRCFALAQQCEVLLRPIGNTVYWMPPYIIEESEMRFLVERTLQIVNKLS